MFTFKLIKDESGKIKAVKLTGIRKIQDKKIKQGVTVRRIKLVENTVPELDAMLSQDSWKVFTGLSQDENFKIYFLEKGKKQPLTVEKEVLSQSEFKAIRPTNEQETNFGAMRIISTKDMLLQVIDKAGFRVCELKEEYLSLIPSHLRHYIKDLGIIIQIPLPLIRNRSSFEYEDEHLLTIQKYVAIEFYKAIAYKTLTQTDPQFVFSGFPSDWTREISDHYWESITEDKTVVNLAEKINSGAYADITEKELRSLLTEKGKLDKEEKFVKLIILLKVATDQNKPQERISLYDWRLAIQAEHNRAKAEQEAKKLRKMGFNIGDILHIHTIPYYEKRISQVKEREITCNQMKNVEQYIIDPKEYNFQENELVELTFSIAKHFGIEQVLLLSNEALFSGAFVKHQGKLTMLIKRSLVYWIAQPHSELSILDETTDTIVHELAHFLEEQIELDGQQELWKEYFIPHPSNFTHQPIGIFAEAMKYIAARSLAMHNLTSASPVMQIPTKASSALALEEFASLAVKEGAVGSSQELNDGTGGIDLSQIELSLRDATFISSLNPVDLKILLAAKALEKDGWNSLALLRVHEVIGILRDGIVEDFQNKELLLKILEQLKTNFFLDPQALQFFYFLQSKKTISELRLSFSR